MKKINYNFWLVIFSTLITLFILEIIFRYSLPKPFYYKYHQQQYRLYQQGKIFQNVNNFFKYEPNSSIRHEVFFDINNKFLKEYSYEIKTNNFGLVQEKDIYPSIPSILFLGDSFTEGIGSHSWVNNFQGKIGNYQIINGGIFGTGPQQFELLEKHINKYYNIEKVVFLYTSGDIERDPFNFSEQNFKCLNNYLMCKGFESYYGFPIKNMNPESFLKQLKSFRDTKEDKITWKKIRRKIKSLIANLYIIKIPRNYLQNNFYKSKNEKIIKNFNSITNLVNKYGENIIFIQIQTMDEIFNKKKNYYSIYSEKFIRSLTQKHYNCEFENDISFFYYNDGHPNKKGYEKLYKCVSEIINNINLTG